MCMQHWPWFPILKWFLVINDGFRFLVFGSGNKTSDICAVCWLCKVSNSVTLPQCYVIHHNIYIRDNTYVAMQQDANIEEPQFDWLVRKQDC